MVDTFLSLAALKISIVICSLKRNETSKKWLCSLNPPMFGTDPDRNRALEETPRS
jgi:hypothetical protein